MSTFTIYPAIDMLGGKCVRLVQGDYGKETVYSEDPAEVAKKWQRAGARWLHLVDLDGAKQGKPVNDQLIGQIVKSVDIPVQAGGGLRTLADVERLLSLGVSRVILGTAAIEDRAFTERVLQLYGDKTAISLDCRDGFVATRGWLDTTTVKAEQLARELAAIGAETFIFTDISRDGMMQGPNVEAIAALAKAAGKPVIASGGVSQSYDLLALLNRANDGVAGAIVGKALYTGGIDLAEAIELLEAGE